MSFASEQNRFIVMAHFRSGTLNPDGNWSYSLQSCIEQFMQQYPYEMIEYDIFKQHKCRLVHRFETKNCICKGKSTGRPTVLTENVIENIQERINRSPKKAVSQLSQQTDVRDSWKRKELIAGQRRHSKFDGSVNAISSEADNVKTSEKLFLSENYTIVQAQIGTTAVLHCEVVDIGESTEWILHIRYSQITDSGLYECQVTTHPAASLFVELQLVEAHADIVGGSEKIVKSGSSLRLSCVLRRSTEPPDYIFWYHADRMINYDLKGGAAVRHGRQGSELIIPRAEMKHAGNYSCVPSNARSANVTVHVLQNLIVSNVVNHCRLFDHFQLSLFDATV
ncbi:hypothetical protein FQA39_LY09213 [Lamprigera yunnana]|nr:hypothetical protein FQA39_LY09213 [Lamprigera yunnana]